MKTFRLAGGVSQSAIGYLAQSIATEILLAIAAVLRVLVALWEISLRY
jgi:hypothetical protein